MGDDDELSTPPLAGVGLVAARRVAAPLRTLAAGDLDRSLASGAAGLAVCFAHLGAATGDARDLQAAERYLGIAVEQVAADPLGGGIGLFAGLTGVAWAELEVGRLLFVGVEPDDDLDALLAQALDRPAWPGPWDLVSGLVGIGVYALARPPTAAPDLVAGVVRALTPILRAGAWSTDSALTFGPHADPRLDHHVDLGLAHGIPGALALLAAAAGRGCAEARRALPEGTGRLLGHQFDAGGFPAVAWAGLAPRPSRLAWCYGDLAVAWALYAAGHALGDSAILAAGERALAAATARQPGRSGVVDAGLCHGTSGVALLFHRLASVYGDAASAAALWAGRLLDEVAADRLPTEPGLLEGRAGVVLALLALAGQDSGWDAALLMRNFQGVQDRVNALPPG